MTNNTPHHDDEMSLETFIVRQLTEPHEFRARYLAGRAENEKDFPLTMRYCDWLEQLDIYRQVP